MKNILVLGDSISMGYRGYVREALEGAANVQYYEENGRFSKYTLYLFNQWVRNSGVPDIVHWNNGIWDVSVEPPLPGNFTPLPDYLETLARIILTMRIAGVKTILFATTTYPNPALPHVRAEDVDLYNDAARALMRREGIEINDLGALVRPRIMDFVCEDNLHLNEAGYRACAAQTVRCLKKYL